MESRDPNSLSSRLGKRALLAYMRFVEPSSLGLPNWRVVFIGPAVILMGFTILVLLGISGSSTGVHWLSFGEGVDPNLIAGTPRTIRSDEWLVHQSWVVSQAEQGFPPVNESFPGGMDATVFNELPSWDWSSIFRPHVWGYLLFGLSTGLPWHWWVPAVALLVGAYLLIVTILPRQPFLGALVAGSVFFTPLLQWFYGPSTLWPVAWAFLAMAGTIWILRERRLWPRALWAIIIGYTAVVMGIGLYVPYIVPSALVYLFFFIGVLLNEKAWRAGGLRALLKSVAPLMIAGVAAIVMAGIWAMTRLSTITAVGSTVYPGARSEPTGMLPVADPYFAGIAGAPWNQALKGATRLSLMGPNSSESASVILVALFVFPALVWLTIRAFRRTRSLDWVLVMALVTFVIVVAYLVIPGWDALAHLLQFDRVPQSRFRIVFVVLLPLYVALVVREVATYPIRQTWYLGVLSAGVATATIALVYLNLLRLDVDTLELASNWKLVAIAIVASVFLLFLRRWSVAAGVLLLVASLGIGLGVNPLYRGIFDLGTTKAGLAVEATDMVNPGTWVGIGSYETMALLVESGVETFNGVQTYPVPEMWEEIDPSGQFEQEWNRLGHVQWELADSQTPTVTNPQRDVIRVGFDPCSPFGQENVSYVLSDEASLDSSCLVQRNAIDQGVLTMKIYDVVPLGR